MNDLAAAFALILDPSVLGIMLLSGIFGVTVGAIPGLTATMAVALLVPLTFFMDPVPAIASIVTVTATAIFAGDIPGALLRLPGTPASAAYTDETYALVRQGRAEYVLGATLVFSILGGVFGTMVLALLAPTLAEVALGFSTFEYFWLAALGLSCAVFVSGESKLRGLVSLLIGLTIAVVGIDVTTGHPRFTFGSTELLGGISLIPAMIGMFAVSEILRSVTAPAPEGAALAPPVTEDGRREGLFTRIPEIARGNWRHAARGSVLGTIVGALPGAGSDIAAWVSFAISKRFARAPEKYGKGHIEGVVAATSANNSALGGTWIPALVFGIPGDSVTAIVIGVMFMKGLNPGPTIFLFNAPMVYAIFIAFLIANLMLLPVGWAAIKGARQILRIPRTVLMPVILLFSMVGAFAINNSVFGIGIMLVLGVLGYLMEANRIPVAPAILALVLGTLLEANFLASMINAQGDFGAFFSRPISAGLGLVSILLWTSPLAVWLWRRSRNRPADTNI